MDQSVSIAILTANAILLVTFGAWLHVAQREQTARLGHFIGRFRAEAVARAAETDFLVVHGDALRDLAEVLRLAGREDAAGPVVAEAVVLYRRKGNVVAAERALAAPPAPSTGRSGS